METGDKSCDIMNRLFYEHSSDEILQKIFLALDPLSLKNCKCVNKDWFEFIQRRLWGCEPSKKYLHNKLINQWKFGKPFRIVHDLGKEDVNSLVCDDKIMVCGYNWGYARVYHLYSGELIFPLQCNQDWDDWDAVQLDLGKTMIGSVTEFGWVSVFLKSDGSPLYQKRYHGEIYSLKVMDKYVLTGDDEYGSLAMVESVEGRWRVTKRTYENKEPITHIDIDVDQKWAVIGTIESIKLWDMEQFTQGERVVVKTPVRMLSFTFPHVFVIGGEKWPGVQMWDITRSHLIRHVDTDGKHFFHIHHHGRFLTVSEAAHCYKEDDKLEVQIYDASELLDTKTDTNELWKRCEKFLAGQRSTNFPIMNAVVNQTCLVVSAKHVNILNFWKDRSIPSVKLA